MTRRGGRDSGTEGNIDMCPEVRMAREVILEEDAEVHPLVERGRIPAGRQLRYLYFGFHK